MLCGERFRVFENGPRTRVVRELMRVLVVGNVGVVTVLVEIVPVRVLVLLRIVMVMVRRIIVLVELGEMDVGVLPADMAMDDRPAAGRGDAGEKRDQRSQRDLDSAAMAKGHTDEAELSLPYAIGRPRLKPKRTPRPPTQRVLIQGTPWGADWMRRECRRQSNR